MTSAALQLGLIAALFIGIMAGHLLFGHEAVACRLVERDGQEYSLCFIVEPDGTVRESLVKM